MSTNIKVEDVKLGDFLTPDGGFDCMDADKEMEVVQNDEGKLGVRCMYGMHLLEGQIDMAHGTLIGFTKHRKAV